MILGRSIFLRSLHDLRLERRDHLVYVPRLLQLPFFGFPALRRLLFSFERFLNLGLSSFVLLAFSHDFTTLFCFFLLFFDQLLGIRFFLCFLDLLLQELLFLLFQLLSLQFLLLKSFLLGKHLVGDLFSFLLGKFLSLLLG